MEKVKGVKSSVNIKDQGTVNYSEPKKIANGAKPGRHGAGNSRCLLYTSDAADE